MRRLTWSKVAPVAWKWVVAAGVVVGLVSGCYALLPLITGDDAQGEVQDPAKPSCSYPDSRPAGELVAAVISARRADVDECYEQEIDAVPPGAQLKLKLEYANLSTDRQDDVVVRLNLAPGVDLVGNSTVVYNESNPDGVRVESNNIATGGIVIGDYAPGGNAFVYVLVNAPGSQRLECGPSELRTVGVARPEGLNEYYNTVIMTVQNSCG